MRAAQQPLIVATRNEHKLAELRRMLPDVTLEALPEGIESPEENGASFAENALIKAQAAARATSRAAIADDSGLEAEALGGRPGIHSARYAGAHGDDAANLRKLLGEVPAGSALRYVCVLAYVEPGGAEETFEGYCTGTRAHVPRGEGGFGYDPIFVPDADDGVRTMAELTAAEKDAISHRGAALRAFSSWLRV